MLKQGYGSSTGKIILMGEHSAVYGYPSIAVPTTHLKTEVLISEEQGLLYDVSEYDAHIQVHLEYLKQSYHKNATLYLKIISSVPISRGAGSSAAVFHAVTRAFADLYQIEMTYEERLRHVNEGDKLVHGNPSGLDAMTVSSNLPTYFEREGERKNFALNRDLAIVIIDSGHKGSTKQAVSMVKEQFDRDEKAVRAKMDKLGQNALDFYHQLNTGSQSVLGALMNDSHEILKSFGLSTPEIDRIIDACHALGLKGSKLTGGGLGGCVIALCDSQKSDKILEALHAQLPEFKMHLQELKY